MDITVSLPSGQSMSLEALSGSSRVGELKSAAREYFGATFLQLVRSDGKQLEDTDLLGESLVHGDVVAAIIQEPKLAATDGAFALWSSSGVITWGHAEEGGDSSKVQDQLKAVQDIQASRLAFAALLDGGSVVTWGDPKAGGDSTEVQDALKCVQHITAAALGAFAAILFDGSVITWGRKEMGGDSSSAQQQLKQVRQIRASAGAFAAILADGSVVTWGHPVYGADSRGVRDQLIDVKDIEATGSAFAALLANGSVVTWGQAASGGDSSSVQAQLQGVQELRATLGAFVAILESSRNLVAWGIPERGGAPRNEVQELKDVQAGHPQTCTPCSRGDLHLQTLLHGDLG
ncbi:unnamed protein product [Durusdinium trenchii]|uniref:Ubiquitin-like domain-containing protein n=1 Tax=Durusdinium trenchii TaxID=1381693 RepID=A0ABP0P7T5_9DINO